MPNLQSHMYTGADNLYVSQVVISFSSFLDLEVFPTLRTYMMHL